MTKGTTMVTNNGFRSTRLFREGSSNVVLFSLQHGTLRYYMTDHTIMVASRNKLRSTQITRMRGKESLRLKSISLHFLVSFMWRNVLRFFFRGRTHSNTKLGTTTWLQQRLSPFLVIGAAIKHLACVLRNSFSHLRSSASMLNKTSLASKSTFKHSNSFSFSRECLASFLYFSTNLLDSLSLTIKSSFSQMNLLKFSWNFLAFFFKSNNTHRFM